MPDQAPAVAGRCPKDAAGGAQLYQIGVHARIGGGADIIADAGRLPLWWRSFSSIYSYAENA
jgi:hypothetical protein